MRRTSAAAVETVAMADPEEMVGSEAMAGTAAAASRPKMGAPVVMAPPAATVGRAVAAQMVATSSYCIATSSMETSTAFLNLVPAVLVVEAGLVAPEAKADDVEAMVRARGKAIQVLLGILDSLDRRVRPVRSLFSLILLHERNETGTRYYSNC